MANDKDEQPKQPTIRAIIGPHAGFRYAKETGTGGWGCLLTVAVTCRYSGPTAAFAYRQLLDVDRIKRVFILGPSHHFYLR